MVKANCLIDVPVEVEKLNPGDPVMNPIPAVGEHTDRILREIGVDPETIVAWRRAGIV